MPFTLTLSTIPKPTLRRFIEALEHQLTWYQPDTPPYVATVETLNTVRAALLIAPAIVMEEKPTAEPERTAYLGEIQFYENPGAVETLEVHRLPCGGLIGIDVSYLDQVESSTERSEATHIADPYQPQGSAHVVEVQDSANIHRTPPQGGTPNGN